MPKKAATLNDFSGGLNDSSDQRDLAPNEFAELTNLDPGHMGKIIPSGVFKSGAIVANGTAIIPGYGLFTFSNDYRMSANTGGFTGSFIAQADGAGNCDVYETDGGGWQANKLTSVTNDNPTFYAAEGDLFMGGGSATQMPRSLVRVDRVDFVGAPALSKIVAFWGTRSHEKIWPSSHTQQIYWENGDYTAGADSRLDVTADCSAIADELIWAFKWSSDAGSGTWNNTGAWAAGTHIKFASSWLYKNGAESDIYVFSAKDYVGNDLPSTGNKNAEDLSLQVYCMIESTTGTTTDE
jgi:hypothetical protein